MTGVGSLGARCPKETGELRLPVCLGWEFLSFSPESPPSFPRGGSWAAAPCSSHATIQCCRECPPSTHVSVPSAHRTQLRAHRAKLVTACSPWLVREACSQAQTDWKQEPWPGSGLEAEGILGKHQPGHSWGLRKGLMSHLSPKGLSHRKWGGWEGS